MEVKEILKNLSNLDGPSGYEFPVIKYIKDVAEKIAPVKTLIDNHGNLIVRKKGDGRKIALFAHTDEIAFVITKKEFGNYFRIHTFGGVDPKVVISQRLRIHTKEGISYGIVGMLEPHLQNEEIRQKNITFDDLFIDVLDKSDSVQIGDLATFDSEAFDLNERYIAGKALDNRASCATLLYTLELLNQFIVNADIYFVFSVREEDGVSGAVNAAYKINPDLAIVLDVTHGDILRPSYPKIETGKGPVLDIGPMVNYEYFDKIKNLAEKLSVNYQIEPNGDHSHTDTDRIQITREGIPTLLISIPLRYMHTPYEVVNIRDMEETARLLSFFLARGGE
ncbi:MULTISPECIES: M20/M25/M40 family metallo-hydrolase [Dictyoglomus]|uniref:Peptidase M42 family protein n=1 Tax=Dictyoglomus turgidum (strain DSM 6724 / Z-1310) TaxID=515635 RepID=B8DZN4_DICTD|nr:MULTISPECIES: M20/M25/M40 family metallo-hydrolase [Dictyoglomus]ACK41967.1 peptidase M42 family protein [Dictyoglomus turgidum DSM 6724]PNV79289.1 MAG: M42 family peptidase [Dictyoglomus turgidum]HBU31473.1 M42 family peptidase [Dictyoglomus sp.]